MSARLLPRQGGRRLPDGRLYLHDGPIDLIVLASGSPRAVEAAFEAATVRFAGILDELCAELPSLRRPASEGARLSGSVARAMARAVAPHAAAGLFITPMAAVAGAVAEAVLAPMVAAAPLSRAMVNNGGDIALHLAPGAITTLGLVDRADLADGAPRLFGRTALRAEDPVRGVATSGAGGRSFSLGIADAVTVLADTASAADAAATIVANAVDLPGHRGIVRAPARALRPDSDLGDRMVTRAVPRLRPDEIAAALKAGAACAEDLMRRGLIRGAALHLQGATEVVGRARLAPPQGPGFERAAPFRGGWGRAPGILQGSALDPPKGSPFGNPGHVSNRFEGGHAHA